MFWKEVEAVMLRPFEWGRADCCTGVCDVLCRIHGVDPMADLRGSYADARGAVRVIRGAGGLLRLAADRFTACGLRPGPATVGAVAVTTQQGMGGLLFSPAPGVWVGKGARGYVSGLVPDEGAIWSNS